MKAKVSFCLASLVAAFLLACQTPVSASARVEQIRVQVSAGQNMPPLIQERMQQSIQVIAGQLIMGKPVAEVEREKLQKEAVIHEVFDKILVGYTVSSVLVHPGEETTVQVALLPWADVIRGVEVEVEIEGMPPPVERIARRDLADAASVFDDVLVGLPLAATDWSNGVLKRNVNAFMERHLPEFRADFELEPGETAKVRLSVYPRLPVVRTINLSMRSDTVPNLMLLDRRQAMQDKVDMLIGVPVSFVRRREGEFCRIFAEALDAYSDFRHMGVRTRVYLSPGERLSVMSRSDTRDYRIRLEGMVDIGRDSTDDDLRFRLHAGKWFSRTDEVFLQTEFFPKDVKLRWALGYSRALSSKGEMSLRYDFHARRFAVAASQRLGDDWTLRYEYRWSDQKGEAALRYRLHDFMDLEYVADSNDNWLRLIGNF